MAKNCNAYLLGKYKKFREVENRDCGILYEYGRRKSRRKESLLPPEFIKIRCKVFWYMDGYVNTKDVKSVHLSITKNNHFHKDDMLYVGFDGPIVEKKVQYTPGGYEWTEIEGYDYKVDGGEIETVLDAIEKNSPQVDLSGVAKVLLEKIEYLEKDHPEELPLKYVEYKEKYKRWMKA